MSTKSYQDKVVYISESGKRIDNLIVTSEQVLSCINAVKALLQLLDKRQLGEKACSVCNQVDQALYQLDKQLFQLTQQPKLSCHTAESN